MATRHVGPGQTYATLVAANNVAQAGDTMIVHGGIYAPGFTPVAGTTWQGEVGNRPIIDGGWNGSVMTDKDAVGKGLLIKAPNIVFSNFEIRYVKGNGISLGEGANNFLIEDFEIHHTVRGGMNCNPTGSPITGVTFRRGHVHDISMSGQWYETPVNGCFLFRGARNVLVEDILLEKGYGEGMAAGIGCDGMIFRRNEIRKTVHLGMYASNRARNVLIEDVLIWQDGTYHQGDGDVGGAFVVGDEVSGTKWDNGPYAENVTLRRCVSVNCVSVFEIRNQYKINDKGKKDGYDTRIKNLLVENCTFVSGPETKVGIVVNANEYGNSIAGVFQNNLFVLNTMRTEKSNRFASNEPRVVFRNNGWTITPPASLPASNIRINLTAIVNPDAAVNAGNPLNLNNYRPVIGGQLDGLNLGALDATAGAPSITASFTRTPSATTINAGTSVTYTDTSSGRNGGSITGRTWRAKKSGTVMQTGSGSTFTYNFPTAGSYTIELSITGSGGLSDTETLAYTVSTPGGSVIVTADWTAVPAQTTIAQGQLITFTSASTVQNGTLASVAWQVLTQPGGAVVASGSAATFAYTFNTVGTWRVKLTATAATGETNIKTVDYTVTAIALPTVNASFTSSDADNQINVGQSVTYTDTSTASVAITSRHWEITRPGLVVVYETTNMSHTFTESGNYTISLRVGTASGVTDTATMPLTVHGLAVAGKSFLSVPTPFVVNTSLGIQTISNAALGTMIPKGVHVRLIGATADGTAATGALWSDGAASSSAQWVHAMFSPHGVLPPAGKRRYRTDSLIMTLDSAGAKTGEAAFVRFVAGGMEINVTDAFPSGYRAEATFYAGDDCRFWAGSGIPGTTAAVSHVNTGIDQDFVYAASCWGSGEDIATESAVLSVGYATKDGTQYHFKTRNPDATNPSAPLLRLAPKLASSENGSNGYSALEAVNFTPTGFDIKVYSSNLARIVSMYAVQTGGRAARLSLVSLPISGDFSIDIPYEGQTVLGLTSTFGATVTSSSGQAGGLDAEGIGWLSVSANGPVASSGSIGIQSGVATSVARSMWVSSIRAIAPTGTTLWGGASTLDADSLGVAFSTAPTAPYRVILLALEVGRTIAAPGAGPVADFTIISTRDDEIGRVVAQFDGSSSNGNGLTLAYAWDFGDGTTATIVNPIHTYGIGGEYIVTLTVTTTAGSASMSLTILVPEPADYPSILIGLADPETSGGHTENTVSDDEETHTHAIRFDTILHIKPMSATEIDVFRYGPADPVYWLVAAAPKYGGFVVKLPDGSERLIAFEPIPPPM